jgi:hypothetical protein
VSRGAAVTCLLVIVLASILIGLELLGPFLGGYVPGG